MKAKKIVLYSIGSIFLAFGLITYGHEIYVRNYLTKTEGITINAEVTSLPVKDKGKRMRNARHAYIEVAYEQKHYFLAVTHKSLKEGQYVEGEETKAVFIPSIDRILPVDPALRWAWILSPSMIILFFPCVLFFGDGKVREDKN